MQRDILILDDVFSALDRKTRWHVATTLLKRTTTIIYTTHDGKAVIFHSSLRLDRGDTNV